MTGRSGLWARIEALLVWLYKIPPEPAPPVGAHGTLRQFQAARGFLTYSLVTWLLKQLGTVIGIFLGLQFLGWIPEFPGGRWLLYLEILGIAFYVLQLPISLGAVLLEYRLRWYLVTDRSLRIREGVLKVREQTMSLANIQNLKVQQGPIQRLLGISDLEVRTAGGGEAGSADGDDDKSLHTAYFRGVDRPEEIRALLLDRLRRLRDSGLGDPDEPAAALEPATSISAHEIVPGPGTVHALAAAREILEEARRLRKAVSSRAG